MAAFGNSAINFTSIDLCMRIEVICTYFFICSSSDRYYQLSLHVILKSNPHWLYSVLEYGSLRLSNGSEGYLEIYLGYDWGFVCRDSFYHYYYYYYYYYYDYLDGQTLADIVCRQIGYPGALSYNIEYYNPYYTYTPNLVLYGCDESTTEIVNCSNKYESSFCDYRWSLVCQTGKYQFLINYSRSRFWHTMFFIIGYFCPRIYH